LFQNSLVKRKGPCDKLPLINGTVSAWMFRNNEQLTISQFCEENRHTENALSVTALID
jgi:hypothetical protein